MQHPPASEHHCCCDIFILDTFKEFIDLNVVCNRGLRLPAPAGKLHRCCQIVIISPATGYTFNFVQSNLYNIISNLEAL